MAPSPLKESFLILFQIIPCLVGLSLKDPRLFPRTGNFGTSNPNDINNNLLKSGEEVGGRSHIIQTQLNRRSAIIKAASLTYVSCSLFCPTMPANAEPYAYLSNPGPLLRLPTYSKNKNERNINKQKQNNYISIPSIGYSLYKTEPDQVERCLSLALNSGVRHFDVATLYKSNIQIGNILSKFIKLGVIMEDKSFTLTEPSVLPSSTTTTRFSDQKRRRKYMFLSHKVSNEEQSTSKEHVKACVKEEMKKLQVDYLDLCSVHSPLTDKERRTMTYAALMELKEEGLVRAVGVCNYGVVPLDEIIAQGLPPPSVIQLELSPFNQHKDVAEWAHKNGSIMSCAAWSKLSSVSGPQDGWAVVASMAKEKGVTKQQILIKWAIQNGYVCVPRSGAGSKIERKGIAENSYAGVNGFTLTLEDLMTLDGLDEDLRAGKLGRRDGWGDDDVKGLNWDPTTYVD